MLDLFCQRVEPRLLDRLVEGIADRLLRLAQRAERDADPEQVVQQLLRLAPADVAVADQQGDQRQHAGAEHAGRCPFRRRTARRRAACAGDAVKQELVDPRRHRRQIDHLVPERIALLGLRQRIAAATARCREAVRARGDLLARQPLAPLRLVTRLSAGPSARRCVLRSCGAIGGRVRRRRLPRVRRVLTESALQLLDPRMQSRDLQVLRLDRRLLRLDEALELGDPLFEAAHPSVRSRRDPTVDPPGAREIRTPPSERVQRTDLLAVLRCRPARDQRDRLGRPGAIRERALFVPHPVRRRTGQPMTSVRVEPGQQTIQPARRHE